MTNACFDTQGNLGAWKVKEGGKIGPGTALVEIETDKATLDCKSGSPARIELKN